MESLQDKIAKRAYELFLKRGGDHGYHIQDWAEAEKEILAEESKKTQKTVVKSAVSEKAPENVSKAAVAETKKTESVPAAKVVESKKEKVDSAAPAPAKKRVAKK